MGGTEGASEEPVPSTWVAAKGLICILQQKILIFKANDEGESGIFFHTQNVSLWKIATAKARLAGRGGSPLWKSSR